VNEWRLKGLFKMQCQEGFWKLLESTFVTHPYEQNQVGATHHVAKMRSLDSREALSRQLGVPRRRSPIISGDGALIIASLEEVIRNHLRKNPLDRMALCR
jgi:hypothetical protein